MKHFYLFALVFILSLNLNSQSQYPFQIDTKSEKPLWMGENTTQKHIRIPIQKTPLPDRDINIVNIIDIGTSANAYEFWYNHSSLWADPNLNTISFYHRMGGLLDPGGHAGDFGYDISTNGGINWNLMIRNFSNGDIEGNNANHGIYNPEGNTDPDEAFIIYNMQGYLNDNSGLIHGISSIGDTTNKNQTFEQENVYSNFTKSGFDISSNGNVFLVTPLRNNTWEYQDSLVITKGVWNETTLNFDYSYSKIEAFVEEEFGGVADVKIAFGSNGQTGFISMIANNGMASQQNGCNNVYPIYWKTTDGGENWEGPSFIQLDGPDGFSNIVYHHLTDELIGELFGENPPAREDISYTTAFDHDIAVDAWGNLNIAVVIGPTGSDPYSIITAEGYLAAYDIFIARWNNNIWACEEMGRIKKFRGTFGDLTEDNRIQITTSPEHDFMFVSWLDTQLEDAEDNNQPDIFLRGFDLNIYCPSENIAEVLAPFCVTQFSDAMSSAYFAVAPKYCFSENETYTIPFVYVDNVEDITAPAQYKYITNFSLDGYMDFTACLEGIEETTNTKSFNVSQNTPNPFNNKTTFEIELTKETDVRLKVFSTEGKLVSNKSYSNLPQGKNTIEFKANNLNSGIYFYTFYVDGKMKSGKMMVY